MTENIRKRVLVVEDDPIHRKVLAALVTQARLDAVYAGDGRSALLQAEESEFAAIILDLHLPELDGFAFIERVRERAPELLPRILVVTGMDDDELGRIDPTEIGGFLRKPIDLAEFQRVLAACTAC